jgi:predicted aconitase with swiveling domain
MTVIRARTLVEGEAEGLVSHWSVALSFWGGFDVASGRVIDRSHPAFGTVVSGRVLVMPSGRGSSSASSVLAEAINRGTAPAAIILAMADPIIAVGAIVARRLYGKSCPVLICVPPNFDRLADGDHLRIEARSGGAMIRHAALSQRRD